MSNEYIFFYSNYDNNSKLLKDRLIKNYKLYKNFHCININDRRLKIPKFITHIPALLVTENGKTEILFEPDASNWVRSKSEIQLQTQTQQNKDQSQQIQKNGGPGINEWDPSSMSGFSDSFSSLESENGMVKNFTFLGQGQEKINTPDSDNSFGGGNNNQGFSPQNQQNGFNGINSNGFHGGSMGGQSRQVKKTKTEIDFERLMNSRKNEIPQAIARQ
jgi:hypothetical protein